MFTIKLFNDFLHGIIWVYNQDNIVSNLEIIDNDKILNELNRKTENLYSSYYEFDSHGQACWFNEEQEKKDKNIMLDLIAKIKARLGELNDGSFEVEDLETERLKNM